MCLCNTDTQTQDEVQTGSGERKTLIGGGRGEEGAGGGGGGDERKAAVVPLLFLRLGHVPRLPHCCYSTVRYIGGKKEVLDHVVQPFLPGGDTSGCK